MMILENNVDLGLKKSFAEGGRANFDKKVAECPEESL